MAVEFQVIKDFGVIADHNGLTLELKLMSWAGMEEKYDLRAWNKGIPYKGMVLTKEEIVNLGSIINEYFSKQTEVEEPEVLQPKEEPKKRGRKPKQSTEENENNVAEETKEEKEEKKTSAKIVQFPKQRPEIEKIVTEGNATYEECEEKLNKEREIFKDGDSQYVIDGVLELCKVDEYFRNNVMREDKSYGGAFEYFSSMAQKGYAMKYGNVTYLDNDLALGMAIDYFNSKPEEKKPAKKTTTTVKKQPAKRGRKKKEA